MKGRDFKGWIWRRGVEYLWIEVKWERDYSWNKSVRVIPNTRQKL